MTNGTNGVTDGHASADTNSILNGHASKQSSSQKGHRIFIYSHPRTASNLFCKLFSEHPQLSYSGYPFLRAYLHGPDAQAFLPEGNDPELKKTHALVREKVKHLTYQHVLDKMEESLGKAEKDVRAVSIRG